MASRSASVSVRLILLALSGFSIGSATVLASSLQSAPAPSPAAAGGEFRSAWPREPRIWVGRDYWANRLQDWRVSEGRLECLEAGTRLPMRTVHLLTRRLRAGGRFELAVRLGSLVPEGAAPPGGAAGFLVGVGGETMDWRSAALVQMSPGRGAGIFAAVSGAGRVLLLDNERPWPAGTLLAGRTAKGPGAASPIVAGEEVRLRLRASPRGQGKTDLELRAEDSTGALIGTASLEVEAARLAGGIALVSHPGGGGRGGRGGRGGGNGGKARFWFRDWTLSGPAAVAEPERALGPILSAQHTLSRGVLKLTAQMMPLGARDSGTVRLEVKKERAWVEVARAAIVRAGFTATFRVEPWDGSRDTPYRVVYESERPDGTARRDVWRGTVRRDPLDKPVIVVAGFTGNHNIAHGLGPGRPYDWARRTWFPHADIARHVRAHDPDLLFFSGDQVYEGASPTFADARHIELDYLYKWYLWCWAYRDLTREIPTVSIPDDHDVYQGNLWGEGGRQTDKDDKGGYVHPAEFIKVVERTQTSSLPDPVDPQPIEQGIGVYFTHLSYGGVGFAILEDRKFKSGCNGRIEGRTRGRADHINDPDFDIRKADVPGLKLLGDRQLRFLDRFTDDWRGESMKMALSQTVFAGMATHHGGNLFRLIADLDSDGWPQSGRRRAIEALRRGFAFHLAGDQHLASLVHHGLDAFDDSIWSFAVPSIANFYPRAWKPEAAGKSRPAGAPPWLGQHLDGFGNRVTVHAVTNPTSITGVSTGVEPLELNDKMPGYGIVRVDKKRRVYVVECWPRWVDPRDPSTGRQYEGWPRVVAQRDNYARRPVAWLPEIQSEGVADPVVRVIDEATSQRLYTLRIRGGRFRPPVFRQGRYRVEVEVPETGARKVLRGIASIPEGREEVLNVSW